MALAWIVLFIENRRKGKYMNSSTNRLKATAIAIFLMFAIVVSLVALPTATAQESTWATYAYLGAVPNPVGVGQEVLLHVGITFPLMSAEMGWEDLSVTIEKPDGTTQMISGLRTDSTGGTGTTFTPTEAGNYTLQSHFPEQVTTATKVGGSYNTGFVPEGTRMLASDSEELTLVVTDEKITYYPGHVLPTEYWTRPIDSQIREWHVVAGNWLSGDRRMPTFVTGNDDAPETAHILWARPLTQGGLVGDPLGEHSFEIGDAYEGKFVGSIILAGKLYYDKYAGPSSGNVDIYREYVCVDLRTGEELWSKVFLNHLTLARGQTMYWDTYDYHGAYDYLWFTQGSTWVAFDAFTADWVYNMTNVPSGTIRYGPKGEILIYNVNTRGGYMNMWNSTNIPALYQSNTIGSMGWGQWRPYGKVVNAVALHNVTFGGAPYNPAVLPTDYSGYQWNVSIPTDLTGSVQALFSEDKVIGASLSRTSVRLWTLNLNPSNGNIGSELLDKTTNAPSLWNAGNLTVEFNVASSEESVFVLWTKENRQYYGYSLDNGELLWGPTASESYLNQYGWTSFGERPALIAYGKMFSTGVSGIVYCYDAQTGDLLYTYHANDQYSEILWANDWWLFPLFITDGKIYYGTLEHSPIDPRPRGGPFICLNATSDTADVIWRGNGLFRQTLWGGLGIIGDSVIATMDTYDQRVYAIGKGPSKTTVTAGPKVSSEGSSVLVEGMVTDVSPGTNDIKLTMRFPNGVPAVCDANQSEWMLYVYKQFERPTDIIGVDVVISVIDPNNNCYAVGTTTSDSSGFFKASFTPLVPGEYTIISSFEGSEAYYGSFAETAIKVEQAPAATDAPTPTPASIADMYLLPATIGIIIAIVVATIVIVLMLRRR